ncbi:OmpA family protein [Rhizobium daejeonense]|uniref:OmpA family protein n=1 Tax=Rhizobium daejeonense TaxID=240521 RepID=A0A6M1RUY2_9HYPH|nr:OmpA family protein [Rhizobium daejeonense]NGO62919.1 OmpA family protein [Rhizobium daejeonense]
MKLRSKLFATVALPVLSAAVMVEPVSASAVSRAADHSARSAIEQSGVLVAQAAVTCSDGSQAADQSACDAIDAQRAAEQQAAEEAQRAAEQQAAQEAQRAAEQQAAEEAQRAAEQQAAEEAQKAAEQQAAEEAKRAAEQQAAEEAQRAAEQQAAEEAQKAAEQQAAEEAKKAAEQQAAEEAQKAAEQQAAEEAQKAAEQQAAEEAKKAAEQQAAEEAQKAAEQQAAQEAQKAAEQQAAEEAQRAAEQKAAEDTQKAAEQQAQQPAAAEAVTCADGSQAASADACPPAQTAAPAEQQPAEQPTQDTTQGETPAQPLTDQSAGQPAGEPVQDGQAGGEQVVVPAVEPPAEVVVPEVVDTRTEEQKQQIAEDPAKTAETVVLPVDNGAAVLDSDKDADNSGQADVRDVRTQAREETPVAPPPESDAAAQADAPKFEPKVIEAAVEEKGKQLNAAPAFQVPTTVVNNITNVTNVTNVTNNTTNNTTNNNHVTNNVQNNVVNQVKVIEQIDNRTVINVGNQVVVRGDDRPRLRYDAQETYYEQLSRGRSRETIERGDGSRLVTIYNRYGDIILRSRFTPDGEEYVLVYSPEADSEHPRVYVDVGYDLPPMRLTVPVNDYIVTMSNAPDRDYYDFLARPPVERVERVYSLDEVKSSARLRDKVRRIDLDTITFPSGSAEVPLAQAKTLRKVADAIQKVLQKDPGEVFLIEGHTDAVGSDRSNLVLSDQRAETVANLLTEVYGIPPENMSTQGYGERYLKIRTQAAEQQNRRVTIRRVTPLVRPANVANR